MDLAGNHVQFQRGTFSESSSGQILIKIILLVLKISFIDEIYYYDILTKFIIIIYRFAWKIFSKILCMII